MQTLIAVNEQMGFLCEIDGIVFIPFFIGENGEYALSSALYCESGNLGIIGFRRYTERVQFGVCKDELLQLRKRIIDKGILYGTDDIPVCIKEIYNEAEKEIKYDRSKNHK